MENQENSVQTRITETDKEEIKNEQDNYKKLINLSEEIGAMLWTTIKGIKDKA